MHIKYKVSMEGMDFNDIEAPLLDEINELIEKERLLLTLKLKEQEDKTNQWKSKQRWHSNARK